MFSTQDPSDGVASAQTSTISRSHCPSGRRFARVTPVLPGSWESLPILGRTATRPRILLDVSQKASSGVRPAFRHWIRRGLGAAVSRGMPCRTTPLAVRLVTTQSSTRMPGRSRLARKRSGSGWPRNAPFPSDKTAFGPTPTASREASMSGGSSRWRWRRQGLWALTRDPIAGK